ncbi:MAG: M6 family metalloprotease domain-containing protein [Thermoplasmatota archaeon]
MPKGALALLCLLLTVSIAPPAALSAAAAEGASRGGAPPETGCSPGGASATATGTLRGPTATDAYSGPRSLVAPPPWSGYGASDPVHGLDRGRLPPPPSPLSAVTGNATVLVILIKFTDVSNSSSHTPAYFENLLFNTSQSSMAKYFADNSRSTFNVSGTVTSKFYTANNTEAWYGTYEFTDPPASGYGNAQNLTLEAVLKADADLDYSKFDGDGDGYVDHLLIIHSGKDDANDGDSSGPGGDAQMWSHAWAMDSVVYLDGVKLYYYTMLSEEDPMGVFAHEFGHDIGLPDLYDTDYSSDGGVGAWDLMASGSWNNGGATPAMLSAWCRVQLGWVSPTVVNSDSQGLEAGRAEDNALAFKVWVNFSNKEYFLVENRQQTGFDASLPGSGLLIWHVNDSASNNNRDAYRLVDLEEADNNNKASESTDPWRSNATGFTPTSSPSSSDYSGKNTGIRIYNISASGSTMTFDVDLGNSAPSAPLPASPPDGEWTNRTRPALNWTFSDPDPGDAQTAFRVQVDDDPGFGSPAWDSGDLVSASNSTTVGADLGEGKWYWRVRTRDTGGLWSGYSSARSLNVDLTAPQAPIGPTVSPSGWSRTNSFSIDWTNPSESGTSGIEPGVYYKLDAAPSGPADGTWSTAKPLSGLSVSGSGEHTIYIWLRDRVGNVNHQNRSSATIRLDQLPPVNPGSLSSPTHSASVWSRLALVTVRWSGASDAHSGVDGFSCLWDGSPSSLPDATKDCEGSASELNATMPADGAWYFHIRSVDAAGNWAPDAAHIGPFLIDTRPPEGALGAFSPSHSQPRWSNLSVVVVEWWGASDGGSGLGGYSVLWDLSPDSLPDNTTELGPSAASTQSPPLNDGRGHYFHIRAVDSVGNWNETALHLGPFDIDTTPPANPGAFEILSPHSIGGWSSAARVRVSWSGFSDASSGVDGFSLLWDSSPLSSPDLTKELEEDGNWSEMGLTSGRYHLHIRTVDAAGNWNGSVYHIGPFLIDLEPPRAPAARDGGEFSSSSALTFTWGEAEDALSGVVEYILSAGTAPGASDVLRELRVQGLNHTLEGALDGTTYFVRVRAVDLAGNVGEWGPESDGVTVDLTPPSGLSIVINDGAALTASPLVTLLLSASDATSGVSGLSLSLDGVSWTEWEPFVLERGLELPQGDGVKTVRARVRDSAGNEAGPAASSITLDTIGPVVTRLRTESGASLVNSTVVGLVAEAEDATSAVAALRLSLDGQSWGDWVEYGAGGLRCELTGPDGERRVLAQARDLAGNIGSPAELALTLDTTPPGGPPVSSPTHPRSDTWYNLSRLGVMWSEPADPSGVAAYEYEFVTGGTVEAAGALSATSMELPLARGGIWLFRVRARDGAGNWGDWAERAFLVDIEGPAPPELLLPEKGATLPVEPVTLRWRAPKDDGSGAAVYRVQVDDGAAFDSPAFDGVVESEGYTLELPKGRYLWRVQCRDAAGNWGAWSENLGFRVSSPSDLSAERGDFFSASNPLMWLVILAIVALVVGGAASAARGRGGKPPARKPPGA